MKSLKKLLSIFAAFMMVVGLTMTNASAADPTGSITVNGTTKDKTYNFYKIFDATVGTASEESTAPVTYTIASDWNEFFTGSGAGAKYLVEKNNEEGTLPPITVGNTTKYINITERNVATFANDALPYAATKKETATAKGNGESVTVPGLAYGYYLMYPVSATNILEGNSSLCSLNTVDGTDKTINVKATYPTIEEKEISDSTPEVGQTVTYTIKGQVPNTTGFSEYHYVLSDMMTSGLTFTQKDLDALTVKLEDDTVITGQFTKALVTGTGDDEGKTGFTLTYNDQTTNEYKGQKFIVSYSAVVNSNAIANVNTNEAKVIYGNNPDKTTTSTPVENKFVTSTIAVNKYQEGSNDTKLANAQFKLYKEDENKAKLYYEETVKDGKVTKIDWVSTKEDGTTKITDENGATSFQGLENGTYYLEEVKAPDGYNLLPTPVTITITDTVDTTVESLTHTSDVANKTGSTLPSTGGMGTTMLYVVGGILMVGAAILFVTNKRMKHN